MQDKQKNESPRMRGRLLDRLDAGEQVRFIPSHEGKASARWNLSPGEQIHPLT